MYLIRPIVANLGDGELEHIVAGFNGEILADRSAQLESVLEEDLQTRPSAEAQVRFIDLVGRDAQRDAVVATLATVSDTMAAEPLGLAVLACYALAFGGTGEGRAPFLQILTGLNFETMRKPGTEEIRFEPDSMSSAIASFTLGTERDQNVRWRFRQFIAWSRSDEGRAHPQYVDLDAEIMAVFGMDYDSLIAASWLIDCQLDPTMMAKRGSAIFRYADLTPKGGIGRLRLMLERFTIDLSDLQALVKDAEITSLREVIFLKLLQTPVVRLDADRFLVPSSRLFKNTNSLGWLYALVDVRQKNDKKESQRLLNYLGAIFEQYAASLLSRIASNAGATFWNEIQMDGWKTTDAMTLRNGALSLYEVVSSRLSAGLLLNPNDLVQIEKDLERTLFEKVDQLAKNVKRVLDGDLTGQGIDLEKISAIYPVVFQYRSFLRTDDLQARINERFQLVLGRQDERVRPIEIVDAELMECLEGHLSNSLDISDLVEEKVGRSAEMRSATFKNFVTSCHPEIELRLPAAVTEQDRHWMEDIVRVAHTWTS